MISKSPGPSSFDSRGDRIEVPLEWSVPLPLDATYSTLYYEFNTEGGDISFAINFIDHAGNARSVLPMTRYASDLEKVAGSCDFDHAGIVVLVWDNAHGWYGSKILNYYVHIRKEPEPINPSRRVAAATARLSHTTAREKSFRQSICAAEDDISRLNAHVQRLKDALLAQQLELEQHKMQLQIAISERDGLAAAAERESSIKLGVLIRTLGHKELAAVLSCLDRGAVAPVCSYWKQLSSNWQVSGRGAPSVDYAAEFSAGTEQELRSANAAGKHQDIYRTPRLSSGVQPDVFVTGYSGRFPSSDSVKVFWNNLCAGKDLVGETKRYPSSFHGLSGRQGEINETNKFDSAFFGIGAAQAACMDPQGRILLECTFEAVINAGYSMEDLAGSNTGVYVGSINSDSLSGMVRDLRSITGYEMTGGASSMFSNRISFCFDLRGPSMTVETACSSSLVAFDLAVRDIRSGKIDRAIVGGVSLLLDPGKTKSFQAYNMLSPDGKCKSFDVSADGYVRSDGVSVVVLESSHCTKDGYLKVLGTGANADGNKAQGITFPSAEMQAELFRSVCWEYQVDPCRVGYVEAHATGTAAGDPQELMAIDTVYGGRKDTATLIGSVKSNMGHAEAASGLMSLVKVLGILSENIIPGNLHFNKTQHESILSGRLVVVDKNRPFVEGGISAEVGYKEAIAISNFGFGGANAHLIGERGHNAAPDSAQNAHSRWIFGRTKSCLEEYVKNKDLDQACWRNMMRNSVNVNKFPWRGTIGSDLTLQKACVIIGTAPVAFIYSGQGCQWNHMAADLWMENTIFHDTIFEACKDLDLSTPVAELFTNGTLWMSQEWSCFGIALVQIGLTAMLKAAGISPDYIIGHSVGEVACAYADGCLTAAETARLALKRGSLCSIVDSPGLMMAAGLSFEVAKTVIERYPEVVVACYNSPDGVTFSGPDVDIKAIQQALVDDGVFARVIDTDGISYHSLSFLRAEDVVHSELSKALGEISKRRTPKWLSTSSSSNCKGGEYAGADYFTRNVCRMVNFCPVVSDLPAGTVVIEVGPTGLLRSAITRCNKNVSVLSVMKNGVPGVSSFSEALDSMWLTGVQFDFPRQHAVIPPSRRVDMRWDHTVDWPVCEFGQDSNTSIVISYQLTTKDIHLMDHVIDGRSLFPAMGHVYTAWMASKGGLDKPFACRNVNIHQAVILDGLSVSFCVKVEGSKFSIHHDGELCATGEYTTGINPHAPCSDVLETDVGEGVIDGADLYSILYRHGYQYKAAFRLIDAQHLNSGVFSLRACDNWTSFLDNMLQAIIAHNGVNDPYLPTHIDEVVILNCDISDVSNRMIIVKPNSRVVGNKNVTIRGLRTTLYRKAVTPVVAKAVSYVPYGEHIYSYGEAYKAAVAKTLSRYFWSCVNAKKTGSISSTAIEGIEALVPKRDDNYCNPASEAVSLSCTSLDVIEHVCSASTLQNVGAILDTAPGYANSMYVTDPVLSCIGVVHVGGLELMAQILRENTSVHKFHVLGISCETGRGGLTQNLYPLLEGDIASYTQAGVTEDLRGAFPSSILHKKFDLATDAWTAPKVHLLAADCNALSASDDISEALVKAADALTPGGFLLFHEFVSMIPALLWGNDERAWSVKKRYHRRFARWTTKEVWIALLKNAEFVPLVWYIDESRHSLVMLAQKKSIIVDPPKILENRADLVHQKGKRVFLRSKDYADLGFIRCLRKEPGYERVGLQLVIGGDVSEEMLSKCPLTFVLFNEGILGGYHELSFEKVSASDTSNGSHVEIASPGNISSLHWVCNTKQSQYAVSFCGLNFKDAMLAHGRLQSPKAVKLGLEFSGHRLSDGVAVMGISTGCMADKVATADHLVWAIPTDSALSLENAATVPVVYATVFQALVCKAAVHADQIALIHSIAGGVGQAAYYICRYRGLRVIVTCSESKAQWVHENLGIPKSHILDSHSLRFREDVLELTNGRGVDVVLNSLSGEKLLASIECLAWHGHFCEIGKYDIQQNSPVGLSLLEKNISFHCIDLTDIFIDPVAWEPVRFLMDAGLRSGEIVPLCTTVMTDIEEGLRYISSGKHIGKVLIDMEKVSMARSNIPMSLSFRTHGTHLVVGGLGGFGLELVSFLWEHGADMVVIVSRGKPRLWQKRQIRSAEVRHCNLKDKRECEELVKELALDRPIPLVGVWHLGMVLNDGLFDNMRAEKWVETVSVKAQICNNLDLSTRKHCPDLEHFVVWSSVSALYGNAGQTNYGYANGCMEQTCISRKADGLAGLAIQWGLIGGVGVGVKIGMIEGNNHFDFAPVHIDSCLEALDSHLLASTHAIASYYLRSKHNSPDDPSSGGAPLSVLQRTARVLGVDQAKVRASDTLSALGMDSLQGVELVGMLKKEGHVFTTSQLQKLTWHELATTLGEC